MKTFPLFRLLACSLSLSACVNSQASSDSGSIVGTWRWTSANYHAIDHPFYTRYGADAKVATWPAPEGWSDSKGVSRGSYSVAGGFLTFYAERNKGAVAKSKIRILKNQLIMTTEDGNRLAYQRVLSPIEPGKLEDGSDAGFSKHPR
jgi:hypothetical protein